MNYIIVVVFVLLFAACKVWYRTLWVTRVNSWIGRSARKTFLAGGEKSESS